MLRLKKWIAVLLALCILLSAATVFASDAEAQAVRVGFFAFDGYHMQDRDGNMSGYGYEIVRYMAEYSELEFVFEGYESSWSQAQDMLEAGEIDMLTSAQMTEERLERFSFSDRPIGTSSAILTVKAGNTAYINGDYTHWSGIRIGMIEGNSRNADLAAFAVEHGFTYTGVIYEDVDAMLHALDSGEEIDAALTSSLRRTDGEWILAQFAPSPFYVMVRKGDTALLSEINEAVAKMHTAAPNIDSLLMEKYYPTGRGNVAFTADEQAVIDASAADPVTVGILAETPPLCYYDETAGEYIGISMQMLRLACENTGLHMEFKPLDLSQNAPIGWLRAGETDIVAGILKVQTFINDAGLVLSDGIVSDSVVMVGRKGENFTESPSEKTLALVLGFQVGNEYVASHFPEHKTVMYNSFADCMDAVASGEADALIYLRTCSSYFLSNPRYESLEIIPAYSTDVVTCAAGIAGEDTLLMSVIDKGLSMISDSEKNAVIMEHTLNHPYEPSFLETLYKYRVPLIVIAALVAVVIAVLIVLGAVRRKTARELKAVYEQETAALQLAKEASAAKGSFMSRMSHEIRTPLNAVIGYNTIARSEIAGAKTEADIRQVNMKVMDYLQKSDTASKHLLTIINDVLDMSAIESGKIKVERQRFDFKSLVTTLTTLFYSQAKAKGVEFEVLFDTLTEEWFLGDQMRVNQVLTNLLSNAVKFTLPGGRVRLSICQPELLPHTARIHFEVTDTGIGMDEEYLAHIWAPFEQADQSISRRFGGTGLGMSITKSLVDLMEGSISVESAKGVGTTFCVDLTFGRTEQPATDNTYDFSRINALVVDDDSSICDYVQLLFARFGARCTTALSGREAIELFTAAKPGDEYTLCLLDWRMPEMDGIETVKQLRTIVGDELPIIIITAYDFSEVEAAARDAGVTRFITKPLFQSSLFNLLADVCGRAPVKKEAVAANYDFAGARVLVAEDNRMNMEVARRILSSAGITVDSAWDGKEAVDIFVSSPAGTYSAVLMDIQMPEMDGYEATRKMRASAHPEAATIPIIAMTADAFAENVAQALAAGMDDHIAKPIDLAILFNTLQKYI